MSVAYMIFEILYSFIMSLFASDPKYYCESGAPGSSNGQRTYKGEKKYNRLGGGSAGRLPMGGG